MNIEVWFERPALGYIAQELTALLLPQPYHEDLCLSLLFHHQGSLLEPHQYIP